MAFDKYRVQLAEVDHLLAELRMHKDALPLILLEQCLEGIEFALEVLQERRDEIELHREDAKVLERLAAEKQADPDCPECDGAGGHRDSEYIDQWYPCRTCW